MTKTASIPFVTKEKGPQQEGMQVSIKLNCKFKGLKSTETYYMKGYQFDCASNDNPLNQDLLMLSLFSVFTYLMLRLGNCQVLIE